MPQTVLRTFKYEAEAFRSYCHRTYSTDLSYAFDSVAILDGILGEGHANMRTMHEAEAWTYLNNLTLAAGAYLGEILVQTCGAEWRLEGDPKALTGWTVVVPGRGPTPRSVKPFEAVQTFLQRGPSQTLLAVMAPFLSGEGKWPKMTVRKATKASGRRTR